MVFHEGVFISTYMSVMFSISASDCSMGKALILCSKSTQEIRTPLHVQSSGQAAPGLESASSTGTQPNPHHSRLISGSSPPDLRLLDARRQCKIRALASGASERETRRKDLECVGDLVSRLSLGKVSLFFWPLFVCT